MPVEERATFQTGRALTLGLLAIGLAVGFLFAVVQLTSGGSVEVRLGDETFEAGDPDAIAAVIERDGPIKYPDLVGGSRFIILQHLGEDPLVGWHAFDLARPGADIEACQLDWDPVRREFQDGCDPSLIFPADGTGLPQYDVIVEDDLIIVDLNAALS